MSPLVLVATPIGNLGDLSPRAVSALSTADVICCEDTRRTGRLLSHFGVPHRSLIVVNDHNESRVVRDVLARLDRGETIAVVTDAGTPGISDPGERLVAAAAAARHIVTVIPGPSAVVSALVLSGMSTARFVFEGFLPRSGSGRTARLAELSVERRTVVLYEAPHRLARTLADLARAFGASRAVAVARELTKLHEEVWRGSLSGAVEWATASMVRGEIVIVVDGAPPGAPVPDSEVVEALRGAIDAGASTRDAAASVAELLGVPRRRAYELATRL